MDETQHEPLVSVIVPVRNDPINLRQCVASLLRSTYPMLEIIVVDDASTDDTADVVREMPSRLVRLPRKMGPAGARNRGAEEARGEYLFFVDADVCVHSDTVEKVVQTLVADSEIDAVFGAYDQNPAAQNFVSQYKNLFHHFVHQGASAEASTFWSGCGAIKRAVFQEMQGFDVSYGRPCIEDIELGVRLRKAGKRIVLKKDIQVTHLKRWTLRGLVKSDFWDRGVPWTELILRSKSLPNDLNLKFSQRLSALLVVCIFLILVVGVWYSPMLLLLALAAFFGFEVFDWWTTERKLRTSIFLLMIFAALGVAYAMLIRYTAATLIMLALLAAVILINHGLYQFFAREKGLLFAVLVIPLHAIYYLYSVAAFCCGAISHCWKNRLTLLVARSATDGRATGAP